MLLWTIESRNSVQRVFETCLLFKTAIRRLKRDETVESDLIRDFIPLNTEQPAAAQFPNCQVTKRECREMNC